MAALLAGLLGASAHAVPGVESSARARTGFMLHCMGCHGPDGRGTPNGDVPPLRDAVGVFARLPAGRRFLVQVPGVANAALDPKALAELLNWMLYEYSAAELPADFEPFTGPEVAELRRTPIEDVGKVRRALLERLRAASREASR